MELEIPLDEGLAPESPPPGQGEAEIYRALLEAHDFEGAVERFFGVLSKYFRFDWGALMAREGPGGRVLSTHGRIGQAGGREDRRPEATAAIDLPRDSCEASLPAEWGNPLTRRLWERGLRRVLYMTFAGSGSALLLAQRSEAPFGRTGRALLERIAAPLGSIFESAARERELEGRVEERTRELAVLYEFSRSAGATVRFKDLARLVMGAAHRLLEFEIGALVLDLPGAGELSLHLTGVVSPECRMEALARARTAFLQLAGRPAEDLPIVEHPLDEFEPQRVMTQGGFVAHQAAPLLSRGKIVGVILALSRRAGAFPESRIRLLHTIANQASMTLERLRTLQEAEEGGVQSIIDSIPNGVVMTDLEFRVEFANPAARRALELLRGDGSPAVLGNLGGMPLAQIARPVIEGRKPTASAEVRSSEPVRIYEVTVSPFVSPTKAFGAPAGIVIVISDVTEPRMMQEQLMQSEKLSALGEMISGVAHELNNPLASVMGFAQLLQGARVREEVRRKLQIVYSESQRCQRVVQNLLSFARKHRPEKRLVDVNSALTSVLGLLSYQLKVDGVEVTTSLDPNLPGIVGDYHLLQQVFLNILNNACQAMREQSGERILEVSTKGPMEADGHGILRVEIADTGPGISPENLKRIFDPFFTTKGVGQGTGLGLSIAYGAVKEHKGQIYARSKVGKGTTFIVELPWGPGFSHDGSKLPDQAEEGPAPPAWILVVEDEKSIGRLLTEALVSAGHRVDGASNGSEALEKIERREYDLIISDLKMPLMDGRELFERVRSIKPALVQRMIFSTGDVASPATLAFLHETGATVIVKPFDIEEVRRTVARRLRCRQV